MHYDPQVFVQVTRVYGIFVDQSIASVEIFGKLLYLMHKNHVPNIVP